jgi:hypothetical protein
MKVVVEFVEGKPGGVIFPDILAGKIAETAGRVKADARRQS